MISLIMFEQWGTDSEVFIKVGFPAAIVEIKLPNSK